MSGISGIYPRCPVIEQPKPYSRRITRSNYMQNLNDLKSPQEFDLLEDNLKDMESNLCKLMDQNVEQQQDVSFFKDIYCHNMMTRSKNSFFKDISPSNTSSLSTSLSGSPMINNSLCEIDTNIFNNQQNFYTPNTQIQRGQYCQMSPMSPMSPMINNNTNNTNTRNRNFYINTRKSVKMTVPSNKRQILEEEFRKEKYPSNEKLQKLSSKLNMRYDEVQNYFKKRRKEEKETNHKFTNLVKLLNNYLEQED